MMIKEIIRMKLTATRDTSINRGLKVIANLVIRLKLTSEDISISRGHDVAANLMAVMGLTLKSQLISRGRDVMVIKSSG
jgi:hypothetical protein